MLDAPAVTLRVVGLALAMSVAVACGGGDKDAAPASSAPEVDVAASSTTGPIAPSEAATLTSDDGRAGLVLPAGALPVGVSTSEVTIAAVPVEELFASDDVRVLAAYELRPDGIQLSQPARLRLTLPADTPAGLLLMLHYSEDGEEILTVLPQREGAPAEEIEVEVRHFSTVEAVLARAAFEAVTITISVEGGTEHDVEVPFLATAEISVPPKGFTVPRFQGSRGNSYDFRFNVVAGFDPAFWHATPLAPADPSRPVLMQSFTEFWSSLKCTSVAEGVPLWAEGVPLWAEVAVELLFEYDVFGPDLEFRHTVTELAAEMRRVQERDVIIVTPQFDSLPRQEDRPRLHSDDLLIDCNAPVVETPTETPTATPTETPPHDGTVFFLEGNDFYVELLVTTSVKSGGTYVVDVGTLDPDGNPAKGDVSCSLFKRGDSNGTHVTGRLSADGSVTLSLPVPWEQGAEIALFCFFPGFPDEAQLVTTFHVQ